MWLNCFWKSIEIKQIMLWLKNMQKQHRFCLIYTINFLKFKTNRRNKYQKGESTISGN